jgi:hypothetical protein
MKKNKIIKTLQDFIKVFGISFFVLLIGGRCFGFTPKELNPISWNELLTDNIGFILFSSFIFGIIFVIIGNRCNFDGK